MLMEPPPARGIAATAYLPRGTRHGIVNPQDEARLDDRPILVAHGIGERVDEFLVGTVVLVIDEMIEPSGRQCRDKSLIQSDARARDRRLEAVELALRRDGTSGLDGRADDDALRVGGRGRSPGMQAMVPTRS
jgi:hypothetical protein